MEFFCLKPFSRLVRYLTLCSKNRRFMKFLGLIPRTIFRSLRTNLASQSDLVNRRNGMNRREILSGQTIRNTFLVNFVAFCWDISQFWMVIVDINAWYINISATCSHTISTFSFGVRRHRRKTILTCILTTRSVSSTSKTLYQSQNCHRFMWRRKLNAPAPMPAS